jgi:hypothetical protein
VPREVDGDEALQLLEVQQLVAHAVGLGPLADQPHHLGARLAHAAPRDGGVGELDEDLVPHLRGEFSSRRTTSRASVKSATGWNLPVSTAARTAIRTGDVRR